MSMRSAAAQVRIDRLYAAISAHEGNASRDQATLVKLVQAGMAIDSPAVKAMQATIGAEEAEARSLRAQAEALIEAAA